MLVREIIDDIAEKSKPFLDWILKFAEVIKQNNLNSPEEITEFLTDHIFREFNEKYGPFVQRTGWVISPNWSMPLIDEILELDKKDTDVLLSNYYTAENIEELLLNIDKTLSNTHTKWDCLIKDCIQSYKYGCFRPVIPSLISIIEGIVGTPENIDGRYKMNLKNYCIRQAGEEKENREHIKAYSWMAINYYIDILYNYNSFQNTRNQFMNRNWIQHGRDNCDCWEKIDAINLFNTLDVLLYLNNEVDE